MKEFFIAVLLILFLQSSDSLAFECYELRCRQSLLEESENIALSQIGISERTNCNDGEVEKYLQAGGLAKGNPYCAAGVYWCFAKAAEQLTISANEIPIPRTGLVANILKFAKKHGIKSKPIAQKHSLLVWLRNSRNRGHIERIYRVRQAGWVDTIGFNTTSDDKTENSEGVYMKARNILHPLGRLRFAGLISFRGVPDASI